MVLLCALLAAAAALGICLAAHPLARALGVMDMPDGQRKLHARPTPQVGGIAVGAPLVFILGGLAGGTEFLPLFASLTVAVAMFLVLGLLDDRKHLRPFVRLAISTGFALVLLYVIPAERVTFFRFSFLEVALFPSVWAAAIFTVLCIVGLQNALNMADGKNGLAVGLLLIWSTFLLAYAPDYTVPALAALIGALAVVFAFNVRGHLFLGDAGTYSLSVVVAMLAIHTYSVRFDILYADVIALWFLIPIVDALRLMATRAIAGASPFTADRRHFHHLLQTAFPSWPSSARLGLYLGLVAIPGALAIPHPGLTALWAGLELSAYGSILLAVRFPAVTRLAALSIPHPPGT